MTPRFGRTTLIVIMICIALPAWGQRNLLYVPQPAPADQQVSSQDGILVREIDIQKGDTLYKLSRRFSGHGMYFPQILLFNDIKDPNLIYTGNTLKVPVTRAETPASDRAASSQTGSPVKQKAPDRKKSPRKSNDASPARKASAAAPASAAITELSLSELNKGEAKKSKPAKESRKSIIPVKKGPTQESLSKKREDSTAAKAAAGQQLYQAAVKAFQQEDCRTALGLFDRYLAENPASSLAADANLYKAECYFKLSAQ
ncbi:MAG: LysM peptidoglycan-binding domain-containing protein [Desulfuromonadaceae bacterium]